MTLAIGDRLEGAVSIGDEKLRDVSRGGAPRGYAIPSWDQVSTSSQISDDTFATGHF